MFTTSGVKAKQYVEAEIPQMVQHCSQLESKVLRQSPQNRKVRRKWSPVCSTKVGTGRCKPWKTINNPNSLWYLEMGEAATSIAIQKRLENLNFGMIRRTGIVERQPCKSFLKVQRRRECMESSQLLLPSKLKWSKIGLFILEHWKS